MKAPKQFSNGDVVLRADQIYWNLSVSDLISQTILTNQGTLSETGALMCDTGKFTDRSPKDRYIVSDDVTEQTIWWGEVNQRISKMSFDHIFKKMSGYLFRKKLFANEVYACASPKYKLGLHIITEFPWQSLFVRNLFISPTTREMENFSADWAIICIPGFEADPAVDGTNSPNFTIINFGEKVILIGGSAYTGEIKKSVFTVLNYLLPKDNDVFPMHCSANIGENGDTAIFLGLSGTGKTTLSADPRRKLIGDDEHGWSKEELFNFEGGCYAKCVNLTKEREPQIYNAIKYGTLLENTRFFDGSKNVNYSDISRTENTRAAFPIDFIENIAIPSIGGTPKNIFFLTADAFGVLPPISKLSIDQAMYHFISGYTAKVAGTETGIIEPEATFSACFGKPFLPLHPMYYAKMLGEKLRNDRINVWLVNTGWTGGCYGEGKRIDLHYTRAMVSAALNGDLEKVFYQTHRIFGLQMPMSCPGVFNRLLNPENAWADKAAYKNAAVKLAASFQKNSEQYSNFATDKFEKGGPVLAK